MATWPTTLPAPLASGYRIAPVDAALRTEMEVGASRTRRRTHARNDRVTLGWLFTDAQLAIFRAWFDNDATGAAGGAAWFTVTLLLGTGGTTAAEVRFNKPPEFVLVGYKKWNVSAEVEVR